MANLQIHNASLQELLMDAMLLKIVTQTPAEVITVALVAIQQKQEHYCLAILVVKLKKCHKQYHFSLLTFYDTGTKVSFSLMKFLKLSY